MHDFEVGGALLGKVHRERNDKKYFCYFTGFVEGVCASKALEDLEIDPLISQCQDFLHNIGDADANDILEDFEAQLLDFAMLNDVVSVRSEAIDKSCTKSSINRFLGLCAGVACDGRITLDEAQALLNYIADHPEILADPFVRTLDAVCYDAVSDGIIDPTEEAEITGCITRLVGDAYCDTGLSELGAVPVFDVHDLENGLLDIDGKAVVLTGNFAVRPRRELEAALTDHGAIIAKSVSRKTDFVLVAAESSRDWIHTHKGTKIVKALELREASSLPRFLGEAQIMGLLGI